jgi:hypothetical protein
VTFTELQDCIAEVNPDALYADGLEDAAIGYTLNTHGEHVVAYDYDRCVEALVTRDGMSHEGAEEYLSFNTLCAYVGPHGPIYVKVLR